AGAAPLCRGEHGDRSGLDRDGDGGACEERDEGRHAPRPGRPSNPPDQARRSRMRVIRITPNLPVPDIAAAKSFYTDYLGLSTEEFNLGWVARYTSPTTGAHVQLVTGDATAPEDSALSVHVDDLDAAYEQAR